MNYIKLIIVLILMLMAIAFNTFISNVATLTNLFHIVFWALILVVLKFLVGWGRNNYLYKIDVMQIIFIFSVSYLLFIYVFGFFFGFIRSPYSLEPLKMIQNIAPMLIVIVLQELVRYSIVSKGSGSKLVVSLLVLTFIALDISMGRGAFPITDSMSVFVFIGVLVLPTITINLLLTYIASRNGYKGPILYRIMFDVIIVYMIPIFPDLGPYLESVFGIMLPVILFLRLNSFFGKDKPTFRRKTKMKKFVFWAPTVAILATLVILTSGLFKLHAMAIGSGSMSPAIHKGDVVVIEKLTKEQMLNLEIGDVIAFEYDRRIIVHRIVHINTHGNKNIYYTKGDYNDNIDNWELEDRDIRGLVRYKIPYIGGPSVWLSENFK